MVDVSKTIITIVIAKHFRILFIRLNKVIQKLTSRKENKGIAIEISRSASVVGIPSTARKYKVILTITNIEMHIVAKHIIAENLPTGSNSKRADNKGHTTYWR
jgi:hypothetical protein